MAASCHSPCCGSVDDDTNKHSLRYETGVSSAEGKHKWLSFLRISFKKLTKGIEISGWWWYKFWRKYTWNCLAISLEVIQQEEEQLTKYHHRPMKKQEWKSAHWVLLLVSGRDAAKAHQGGNSERNNDSPSTIVGQQRRSKSEEVPIKYCCWWAGEILQQHISKVTQRNKEWLTKYCHRSINIVAGEQERYCKSTSGRRLTERKNDSPSIIKGQWRSKGKEVPTEYCYCKSTSGRWLRKGDEGVLTSWVLSQITLWMMWEQKWRAKNG